ncbi:FxLD family lanthipeptide [Streptomyces harbinensis]|uniref:FxLD family lanthipeptide n=1 Tax=Streptomyces harbinensis TaxID=1176198 RepID=UPI00371DC550
MQNSPTTDLLPPIDEDGDFTLDVRVVLAARRSPLHNNCPTDDGCGATCENGASACDSFVEEPA